MSISTVDKSTVVTHIAKVANQHERRTAMSDIEQSMEHETEARLEREADAALDRIQRGQQWSDWLAIGELLVWGRNKAMRRAGTNQPVGAAYNKAFGGWMDEHAKLRSIDSATRNHSMWCADHRTEIETWRETLASNQRQQLNHPTATKRRYEASIRAGAKPDTEKKLTAKQRFEEELLRLEADNTKLRRQLDDGEGSLFDLKQTKVETIAEIIADTLRASPSRMAALAKAIGDANKEVQARANEARKKKAQAG